MAEASTTARRLTMREAVRTRILTEVLGRAQQQPDQAAQGEAAKKRFVMVLDARSTRVLSSALLSHDLGEQGVALVENLFKSRQPFRQLEAIYIVEPTAGNLGIIERDFYYWDEPLYMKAHVFLTRKPSTEQDKAAVESLRESLRGVKVRRKSAAPNGKRPSRLVNLLEANIDFLAVEDNAFHLDLPKSLVQLFGPSDQQAVWCENRIVDGVASLCATLHEYPFVRYTAGNSQCENLARGVNDRVEGLMAEDTSFWFHGKDSGARATLLFLDRRQDLAAPLLHEFSYQALVYDLLESRDNLIRYVEPKRVNESEEEYEARRGKPKKALLNETDGLWVQFRHSHITVVIDQLNKITKELRATTVGQYMEQGGAESDLEVMQQVVVEMQAFKEVMAKHAMHLAVAQACMDQVNRRALIEQARTEQTVVSGVDGDGERATETRILNELAGLMRRNEPTPADKLRLACLHAVTLGQANQEVVLKFLRDANLPIEAQSAVIGLGALGVSLISAASGAKPTTSTWMSRKKPLPGQELETAYRSPEAIARAVKMAQSAAIKTSRFAPLVRHHLEAICGNRMTMEDFPFIKPPPPNSGIGGTPIDMSEYRGKAHRVTQIDRSLSVRKHGASTASAATSVSAVTAKKKDIDVVSDEIVYQGGRIIIFIAGGASYSELRAINEVMKLTKREVIIGSTHLIRPEEFIKDLELLADDVAAKRYMEEDILASGKDEFFLDDEEMKLLDNVLIDGKVDPAEVQAAENAEFEKERAEMEGKADLGIIPWIFSYVPYCGKPLAAWFNGDDVKVDAEQEEEDDGIKGDLTRCVRMMCPCCLSKSTKEEIDRAPLVTRGQTV